MVDRRSMPLGKAGSVTEQQRLFLVQARSNFAVFELFRGNANWPVCHGLHYLQMSSELLGKAYAWRHSRPGKTHRALVSFLQRLSHDRRAQQELGFEGQNANWMQVIRKSIPLAQRVEDLAPSLDRDGPNPEYPWPSAFPTVTPVEHEFDLWTDLNTPAGRQFLTLLSRLFQVADAYL